MRALGKRWAVALALAVLIGLAIVGWLAAQQIRSPAQVAAETAPPQASPITVPVEKRTLSTVVIVRGTVRYGAPQAAELGTSQIRQGSDVVTQPPRRGARLGPGDVAMAVDDRPVFVLPGAIPMHRDLGPGDEGPDVRQLEQALAGLGLRPGAVDGRYDAATAAAVSALYLRSGWDPFGPTDLQLEQLRTAEAAAAQARDAHLQAVNAIDQALQTPTPADVAQARIDAVTAGDAVDTAVLGVATARAKLESARMLAASAPFGEGLAEVNARRDQAAADADVAAKRAALNAALDEERLAGVRQYEVPLEAPPSERQAAAVAVRQAAEAVAQAQADLAAAIAAAEAISAGGSDAVQRARNDGAQAKRDVRVAEAELHRARLSVRTARAQAELSLQRVRALTRPVSTRSLRAISVSAARERRRTRAQVEQFSEEAGVQVPANEILFFASLPLRVDAVTAKRGSTVSGSVMSVTGSRLTVDSSLSVSDAKLVRPGDPVTIEEEELGVQARGRVGQVADTPGTHRVDPTRFYFSVVPATSLPSLVGASVKLTIAVKSSKGAVLAVPVSALSIGGDGRSRVQVRRGGRTELATVVPGLAAEGLVEIRPTGDARLRRGDLVIVGGGRDGQTPATAGAGRGP